MKIIYKILIVSMFNILWTICGYAAAPLLETRNTKETNIFAPLITAACSSDGQCWEWLPVSGTSDKTIVVPEEENHTTRLQFRRQIANPMPEFALKSWKDDSTLEKTKAGIRTSASTDKQISSRIAKKDIFVSRNWGAGGMPFSVLYMNPHSSRSSYANTVTSTTGQRQNSGKTIDSTPSIEHSNYRVILRNGQPTVQPRRQYSIIPQLFISYGWGPFGK